MSVFDEIQSALIRGQRNRPLLMHQYQKFLHSLIHRARIQQALINQLKMGLTVDKGAAEIIIYEKPCRLAPVSFRQRGKLKEIIYPFIPSGNAGRKNADLIGKAEFASVGYYIYVSAEILTCFKTCCIK